MKNVISKQKPCYANHPCYEELFSERHSQFSRLKKAVRLSKESLITAITEPSRRLATQTARVLFPGLSTKNVSTRYARWRASGGN